MARQADTNLGGSQRRFPSTLWTMVSRAGNPDNPLRHECLEELISVYWKPVYCYVRAIRKRGVEDAKDVTQGFFTRLLDKKYFQRLSKERGSFRGFLKRSIYNYIVDISRHEKARRPKGGKALFQCGDVRDVEAFIRTEDDPAKLFEAEWNRTVVTEALSKLEQHMKEKGLEGCYKVFQAQFPGKQSKSGTRRLTQGGMKGELSYRDIGKRLGLTENAVRMRLFRCRSELRDILRERIREYVQNEKEVAVELKIMTGK